MDKDGNLKTFFIVVGFALLSIFVIYLFIGNFGATWSNTVVADFNNGTYEGAHYNTTYSGVSINNSGTTGNYTSEIVDLGADKVFNNITWIFDGQQFPENQRDGQWVNMSGNLFLMHFNGNANDYSGNGYDGTVTNAIHNTTEVKI